MTGIVFTHTLRASWKHIAAWSLGMGLFMVYLAFLGGSSDVVAGYANLMQGLPEAMTSAFGADAQMMSTTEGFILAVAVGQGALILMAQAVSAGFSIVSNDENSGILDLVISLPISRTRYIVERGLAWMLITFIVIAVCCLVPPLVLGALGVEAEMGMLVAGCLNMYPGLLLTSMVSVLLGTTLRRRNVAIGAAAAFVLAGYVFNIIGASASGAIADLLHNLSIFRIISAEPIVNGNFDPGASYTLVAIALICFAGAVYRFNRRDIGI